MMPEIFLRLKVQARNRPRPSGSNRCHAGSWIDIPGSARRQVDEFAGQKFDYVITVCDNALETRPVFFGKAQSCIIILKTFACPTAMPAAESTLPSSLRAG
jgi:protein-tyrosine-phosphatase